MDIETSMYEDEAQLANLVDNRSSSESSPGFNFSFNPRKNLKESFDKEVARLSNDRVVVQSGGAISKVGVASSLVPSSRVDCEARGISAARPPLHRHPSSSRNDVNSSRNKVAVFLRIRPPSPLPVKKITEALEAQGGKSNTTIEILDPTQEPGKFPTRIRTYPPNASNSYRVNINRQARDESSYAKEYHFDCIMGPETSQKTVYSAVGAPMLRDLCQSLLAASQPQATRLPIASEAVASALIFSYGITNAGKTHTVLGDLNSRNQSDLGIIPRAISDVLEQMSVDRPVKTKDAKSSQFLLYVSYFEIYNEQIFDLIPSKKTLKRYPFGQAPPPLKVRECRGQTLVRGLAKHKIENTEQGIELTKQAQNKRHTSSNNINAGSSRSHFVCQMQIVRAASYTKADFATTIHDDASATSMSGYSTDEEASVHSQQQVSTIWIVDLAGSERSKRTNGGGKRQKESTQINMSLMTLMRCLNAIKDQGRHGGSSNVVPFRESKLTHIFMSHFTSSSAARTAIMVNVNPTMDDFDETQHVLAYATKAKLIEMDPEEYNRKRKQYFGEEYDLHGRKKAKAQLMSPSKQSPWKKKTTLLLRIAKKLSPKRAFQKMSVSSLNVSSSVASTISIFNSEKKDEIEALKTSLNLAQQKIESLEYEKAQLQDDLETKEDQIRIEVAEEMEDRLRKTRQKHQQKCDMLQAQVAQESSKTAFTVKMGRAESQLEELMDKIDECEKEMARMNQAHRQEVATLQSEISDLRSALQATQKEKQDRDVKLEALEKELERFNSVSQELEMQQMSTGPQEEEDVGSEHGSANNDEFSNNELLTFNAPGTKKAARKLRHRKPLGNASNTRVR